LRPFRTLFLVPVLTVLFGCAVEQAAVAPEGLLNVLGPFPGFSPVELPGDWALEATNDLAPEQLQVTKIDGVPSLRVTNGEGAFTLVRRTRALMLATPFLSWSWNIEPPSTTGYHPIRIVVGFITDRNENWREAPEQRLGDALPIHDKAITLTWGESALQRGTMFVPKDTIQRSAARYTVRGGRENAGAWWLETVDLSDLYKRAWPNEDTSYVQVVFIGIAAPGGREPAPANVSGILLSR